MNHTREVISLWERNHTQHKLFAQNENGIMNNDANCCFANVICAGKVLVRGPEPAQSKKIANLFAAGMALRMSVFCLAIEAQYLSSKMLLMRKACLNWQPPKAVFAQCMPSHPTLAFPIIHRTSSPFEVGERGEMQ
jgi:hypothetical protein